MPPQCCHCQRPFRLRKTKAAENEKITKDKHAGAGALGAGRQMMQAAADEEKKQMQVEKNEKHRQMEQMKQEQTSYVEALLSEMERLKLNTDVGTVLKKKSSSFLSTCLRQAFP